MNSFLPKKPRQFSKHLLVNAQFSLLHFASWQASKATDLKFYWVRRFWNSSSIYPWPSPAVGFLGCRQGRVKLLKCFLMISSSFKLPREGVKNGWCFVLSMSLKYNREEFLFCFVFQQPRSKIFWFCKLSPTFLIG